MLASVCTEKNGTSYVRSRGNFTHRGHRVKLPLQSPELEVFPSRAEHFQSGSLIKYGQSSRVKAFVRANYLLMWIEWNKR